MKGISTIIAVLLLLMITVALFSLFYAFSMNMFGSVTSDLGGQTDAAIKKSGTELTIISAKNTSLTVIDVTIRNSGTQNIGLDTLVAFVDDTKASETASGAVAPGGTSTFTVTASASMSKCNSHVLMLSVADAPNSYSTIIC